MLQVVGEPRRIDRAIRHLRAALKGVPVRGVRLTWRGGELRTTIHWARDDAFWWTFESRTAREALMLGHAPHAPTKRESITCEINLLRAGADRKVAGLFVADSGTLAALPFACVRYRWRGARAVFDGLDDALE
jgi:hypothetical protein